MAQVASPSPHAADGSGSLGARLNWLRAGVLGANDGIVSGSGLMIGVAAADPGKTHVIVAAGLAGLCAGAAAMAMGEYVSVSSQRDTEKAAVALERQELAADPEAELEELTQTYRTQGLSEPTARQVAAELTAHDALGAHLRAEFGLPEDELVSPWHAALASAVAFFVGSVLPLLTMLLAPAGLRIPATIAVAVLGLLATGWTSAALSGSPALPLILRNVVGGCLAMALTWSIGHLFGVTAA
ncbi:VIT family protein [Arsenicicoccus dermatophilus]|uniref:VIT1/CCC1 transporter family protein n=1 Tax=Arsenicicoccus dermatophilus TaxID=1076331 RepID=UPI003917614E